MTNTPYTANPVDFRRTFLCRHIAAELQRTSEILALSELEEKLLEASREPDSQSQSSVGSLDREAEHQVFKKWRQICPGLWPQTFFYSRLPDTHLYRDVKVIGVNYRRDTADSLTTLLRRLFTNPDSSPGLVLSARSGSGKTVASRRAFFDCFFQGTKPPPFATPEPNLFGFLPCWLDLSAIIRKPTNPGGFNLVVDWISEAAAQSGITPTLVDQLLKVGPPMLIFGDLNAVLDDGKQDQSPRLHAAQAFVDFLRDYSKYGHRVVLTYRVTEIHESVLHKLIPETNSPFAAYDLLPLGFQESSDYVKTHRAFEQDVFQKVLGILPPNQESLVAVQALVQRFSHSAVNLKGLISTPLLMHFISQVGAGKDGNPSADEIISLADLFRATMLRYLLRDQKRYAKEIPSSLREHQGLKRLRAALVRLAITMNQAGSTRLGDDELDYALTQPLEPFSSHEFWQEVAADNPYYSKEFNFKHDEITALRKFSLLHRGTSSANGVNKSTKEANQLGFVHDSFIYYFVGAGALGEYLGPGKPPPPKRTTSSANFLSIRKIDSKWREALIDLFRWSPSIWKKPAGFLAGSLSVEELQDLLVDLSCQETSPAYLELVLSVLAGRHLIRDPILEGFSEAVSRVAVKFRSEERTFPLIHSIRDYFSGPILQLEEKKS